MNSPLPACLSVCLSACPLVFSALAHYFFLILCMKLGDHILKRDNIVCPYLGKKSPQWPKNVFFSKTVQNLISFRSLCDTR